MTATELGDLPAQTAPEGSRRGKIGNASTAPPPVRRRRAHRRHATWAWNTLAMVLAALIGFPVYWMLITAFKRNSDITTLTPQFWPEHPTWRAFSEVLHDPIFRSDLRNSAIITVAAVAISIVIGFFGAMAIARFRFAGRKVFVFAVLIV